MNDFRRVINDDDYWARRSAIVKAWAARDVDALINGLRDPDHRGKAARYLGRVGDERALEPLRLLLRASDWYARSEAATALGALRLEAALEDLFAVATSDNVAVVRAWAVDAVRQIGQPDTASRLAPLLHDDDAGVRAITVRALGELGTLAEVAALQDRARTEPLRLRLSYRRAVRAIRRRDHIAAPA